MLPLLFWLLCYGLSWHQGGGQKLVKLPEFSLKNPDNCPLVTDTVYRQSTVRGSGSDDKNNVKHQLVAGVADISTCVDTCCNDTKCHVSLLYNGACHMVSCSQDSYCLPARIANISTDNSTLVLVRSPSGLSWSNTSSTDISSTSSSSLSSEGQQEVVCEVGLDAESCHEDEVCQPMHDKSRNGLCQCKPGTVRLEAGGGCTSTRISVQVDNKTVVLPLANVSLTAVVEAGVDGGQYKYQWTSLSLPTSSQGVTVEEGAASATLSLSHLVEGVYMWKVTVTGSEQEGGYGETVANVTVLPATRVNTPPRAVIAPLNQTVTLPTSKAIIDGSGSTDDTPLESYLWELISGPVGYQPKLDQQSIITLSNLTVGNYTLKLTVTDKDGLTDSATATVEVVKDTDYPPKAVAGEDIVLYLPNNNATLNGNQSTDDHKIVSWEWTKVKADDGEDLPADISGARTPFITVSNLQQGQYNFVLKVTDEAGQSDEDDVKVYVKPPTNRPPKADAGPDQDLNLPLTYISLDGSKSSDDGNITAYRWSLTSTEPPSAKAPVILSSDSAMTNVTGLGVGSYTFKLMVEDNSGNTDSDMVQVKVKQDTNMAPVADPGDNVKIVQPVHQVVLDGSGSSDDLGVEKWIWTRDPDSLAAGDIVGNMSSPQLIVSNLVPGVYSFNLQVVDGQGLTSNKSVKVTLAPDPERLNIVEVILNKNLSHFRQSQRKDVVDRIRLLSKGKGELSIGDETLTSSTSQGLATLHFKVFSSTTSGASRTSLSGLEVVSQLKRELAADPELLGVPVISIDTLVCQNTCSGHGYCDQATRACVCQTAWMENVIKTRMMGGEANCDWSVVYVVLLIISTAILFLVCCCLNTCKRKVVKIRAKRKYSRLSTADNNMEMAEATDGSLVNSESDSEEEILFESSKKSGNISRLNGSVIPRTNGLIKNGKLNT